MCIESKSLLAFVEFKKGSGLGEGQLAKYRNALNARSDDRTIKLILVTVCAREPNYDEEPDEHWRWYEIDGWLQKALPLKCEVCNFLVSEFARFLGDQFMNVEHVDVAYLEGVSALMRLSGMLNTALNRAGVPLIYAHSTSDFQGFSIDGRKFWMGVYLDTPKCMVFEFYKAKPVVERFTDGRFAKNGEGRYSTALDLEATQFFAQSKEAQLERVSEFVTDQYQYARLCVDSGTV